MNSLSCLSFSGENSYFKRLKNPSPDLYVGDFARNVFAFSSASFCAFVSFCCFSTFAFAFACAFAFVCCKLVFIASNFFFTAHYNKIFKNVSR